MRILKRIISGLLVGALVFTAVPMINGTDSAKAVYQPGDSVAYLSDLNYIPAKSFAGKGSIMKDRNGSNRTITLVTALDSDGNPSETKTFIKGVAAWATSEIVYEIPDGFDQFQAIIGVDSAQRDTYYNNGVTFQISLSTDGDNWEVKKTAGPMRGWNLAERIEGLSLSGYRYIKLRADENGNSYYTSWYDDAVYADARFIKSGYSGENITLSSSIKTVAAYDEEISGFISSDSLSDSQKLTVLQREYVNRIGYNVLSSYYTLSNRYKNTIDWLFNNLTNLQYYMDVNLGSSENYAKSLTILADLYATYKADLDSSDLYKRMAIALACSHVNDVRYWADGSAASNGSNAVKRYEIFKDLRTQGRLNSALFDDAEIPELRIIMANQISDDQIEWLNWYAKSRTGSPDLDHRNYIRYNSKMDWSYSRPEFFVEPKKSELDAKYSLTDHGVDTSVTKLWAVMEEGAVCGGQSKTGANLRGVYGEPSFVIGQPGHAAYFYQEAASGGKTWAIGNNIYGWWKSEYGGNMLGWTGNFNGIRWAGATGPDKKYYTGSYLVLEQAAVNNIDALRESQYYVYLADIATDLTKKESLYKKAIEKLNINVKAWLGLLDVHIKNGASDNQFYALAEKIAEAFKYYPLPMSDLLTLIKNNYVDLSATKSQIETLRVNTLTFAKDVNDGSTLQQDVTRQIANNLLNESQVEMATFSLDGPNAGQIIFDPSYTSGGSQTNFRYSLTGAITNEEGSTRIDWITSSSGTIQLTPDQIDSLSEELGILVNIEGLPDSSAFSITLNRAEKPEGLAVNDNDDVVVGAKDTMEWSLNGTDWTRFDVGQPDLSGNVTVKVRNGATGHTLVSLEYEELEFHESTDPIERRYISATNVSVVGSTSHNGNTQAANVLDGNEKTYWSSNQRGGDGYKRLIFTFDKERYVTAIEILPRQDSRAGRPSELQIAITDANGTVIKELQVLTGLNQDSNEKIIIPLENPVYIKHLSIRETNFDTNFVCLAMVNFYEDRTKSIEEDGPGFTPDEEEIIELTEDKVFNAGLANVTTGDGGEKFVEAAEFRTLTPEDYMGGASQLINYLNCYVMFTTSDGTPVDRGSLETGMKMQVYNYSNDELTFTYTIIVPEGEDEGGEGGDPGTNGGEGGTPGTDGSEGGDPGTDGGEGGTPGTGSGEGGTPGTDGSGLGTPGYPSYPSTPSYPSYPSYPSTPSTPSVPDWQDTYIPTPQIPVDSGSSGGTSSSNTTTVQPQAVTATTVDKTDISRALLADNEETESYAVSTETAVFSFDQKAMEQIVAQAAGNEIKVVCESKSGSENVYSLYLECNGVRISDFKGGKVTVGMIDFKIPEGKNPKYYHVYYLPDNGKAVKHDTWYSKGYLHFNTTHFSDYEIIYDETMENSTSRPVYRLYNRDFGEHILTLDKREKKALEKADWDYEGIAFYAGNDGQKVYRLFNARTGMHFFTADTNLKKEYESKGWNDEGVAFIAEGKKDAFCLTSGKYQLITKSKVEKEALMNAGWKLAETGLKVN